MTKLTIQVNGPLLLLAFLEFTTRVVLADVHFLPKTKEELDSISGENKLSKVDPMIHVEGAKVAYFHRAAMERDFPFLKGKSDSEIEAWILKNCAYMSKAQLELNGIRQSPILKSKGDKKEAFRPDSWNRAAVVPVSEINSDQPAGLIDIKGVGLPIGSPMIKSQVDSYKTLKEKKDKVGLNQLRTLDHNDGLATLGEGIAEVVRAEALQKSFDRYNLEHHTDYQTVEHYFLISLPFNLLKEDKKTDPAVLIGRQAHLGRHQLGKSIPDDLYIDIFGSKQSDLLGAAVDMGGVFPTAPEYRNKFLTRDQIKALSDESIMNNQKLRRQTFDPQKSEEWRFAHETAKAYLKGEAERRVIYNHLHEMVGDRPVNHHSRSLTLSDRLKAMFLARDSKIRESAAFAIGSYRGSDAHLLFEEAFSHPDADVRKNATHALRSYRGLDASLIFDKALTHSDREVRKGAASALGTYQGPDAYLLFEKAFAHSDVEVRKRAASVLGTYRGSDARLLLGKALTHSDIEIRKSAALALKFAEPVDAQTLHLLLELLKNEKQDIRNEVSSLIKDLYPHLFRMEEEKTKPLTDYLNLPCEKPIDQVFPTDDLDKIIKYLDQQDLVQ